MSSNNFLTVITATYNSDSTIQDTFESILKQTEKPDEVLIIDGGSSDNTLSICKKYEEKLPLRIISEPDNGIYDAMNKGLRHSKGGIIGFLNSDDVFAYKDCVKDLKSAFDDENIHIVYGNLVYVYPSNLNRITRRWISGEYTKDKFEKGWCMPHPTFYARKIVYEEVGEFNLEYDLAADYDFIWRCVLNENFRVKYLDKTLVKMREGGATSRSWGNIVRQNLEILKIIQRHKIRVNLTKFIFNKLILKIYQRLRK